MKTQPLDLSKLRVFPLSERQHLTRAADILFDPDSPPPAVPAHQIDTIQLCAEQILNAAKQGRAIMLTYGAHLLRNGTAVLLDRFMQRGWLTHLATNGAGTIHDWEFSWFGASSESVKMNVANGTFGTWDETARNIHIALMAGALHGLGYGRALGRFIHEDGVLLPEPAELTREIAAAPSHALTAARSDLLRAMEAGFISAGPYRVEHRYKQASILAQAWKHGVPFSVHPGIGYDIIANHPIFNGGVIGRGAEWDFKLFGGAVEQLDGGVVLSVGSAIMGPQVFEKALSCVNNLRLQAGREIVREHNIYVVDLQDGGNWDWSQGEPPKNNPAYYLRFCKSYSRMGGTMRYLQCDNAAFMHNLYHALRDRSA